ncbi:hypothetical protein [Erwinia sp. V71]|uniref:hypothetical protein n=1 Tax=Erwinia sp. V71 TaxID=3369424 RepID=UPI003F629AFC
MLLLSWLTFLCADFALAMLSLQVRDVWSLSSLVWFPAGMVLGVICALRPRDWPLWLLSAALVHLLASQLYGRPVTVSLIFCGYDLLLLTVTALLWQLRYGAMFRLAKVRDMLLLVALCVVTGLLERLASSWTLWLLDYPTDHSVSFIWMLGYILSYIPLTFFTFWLITSKGQRQVSSGHVALVCGLLLLVALLFFSPDIPGDSELRWQDLALIASLALPVGLALYGELLLLSGFLACAVVIALSATLSGYGPFLSRHYSQPQSILLASGYCAVFALPALQYAGAIAQKNAQLARQRVRMRLLDSALQQGLFQRFLLQSDGAIRWRYQCWWPQAHQAPASWSQFVAWLHSDDREAVAQLQRAAGAYPQHLPVRIADFSGHYYRASMVLVACQQGPQRYCEGVIFPVARHDAPEEAT